MSALLPSKKSRPEFRNIHVTEILRYRYPPAALVSIMHRISGAALFLLLPLLLWLFDLSLISEGTFAQLREVAGHWFMKLVLLGVIWALLHHLVAGIRYLTLDVHIGLEKAAANTSAMWVYFISVPLTLIAALRLFGVF